MELERQSAEEGRGLLGCQLETGRVNTREGRALADNNIESNRTNKAGHDTSEQEDRVVLVRKEARVGFE